MDGASARPASRRACSPDGAPSSGRETRRTGAPARSPIIPFYYRTADRRAVAIAVHLYEAKDWGRNPIRCWAAQHQPRVAFPADFPSWWVPAGTTLCVYEALVDRPGRAAMDERTRDSRGFEAKGGLA